ncbi:MAG: hypothetical protein ACJA2D_000190 [Pseudohongiellaceae bacterium]
MKKGIDGDKEVKLRGKWQRQKAIKRGGKRKGGEAVPKRLIKLLRDLLSTKKRVVSNAHHPFVLPSNVITG